MKRKLINFNIFIILVGLLFIISGCNNNKCQINLYIDNKLFKQVDIDDTNYSLPTEAKNYKNLIWIDDDNKIYTTNDGKGIEKVTPNLKLKGKSVPEQIVAITDLTQIKNEENVIYVLTKDFDLKENINYVPIELTSTLYGNNHSISNLKLTEANSSNKYGIFSKNTGAIYNLNINNISLNLNIDNELEIGLLVVENSGLIINCNLTGNLILNNKENASEQIIIGGLVGENSGTVKNSSTNIQMVLDAKSFILAGNLVGLNNGSIDQSSSKGQITLQSEAPSYSFGSSDKEKNVIGGLVGKNGLGHEITNSYSTSLINVPSSNCALILGGLVGLNQGQINSNYATGNIDALNEYGGINAGGLVGINQNSIKNTYASGNISIVSKEENTCAGGLVGSNYDDSDTSEKAIPEIITSYATGNVYALSSAYARKATGGGLVGINSGSIKDCLATGNVLLSDNSYDSFGGGLVGDEYGKSNIENCFKIENQIINCSQESSIGKLVEEKDLTTDFYQNALNFAEAIWNFTTYPTLKKVSA